MSPISVNSALWKNRKHELQKCQSKFKVFKGFGDESDDFNRTLMLCILTLQL